MKESLELGKLLNATTNSKTSVSRVLKEAETILGAGTSSSAVVTTSTATGLGTINLNYNIAASIYLSEQVPYEIINYLPNNEHNLLIHTSFTGELELLDTKFFYKDSSGSSKLQVTAGTLISISLRGSTISGTESLLVLYSSEVELYPFSSSSDKDKTEFNQKYFSQNDFN